MGTARRDTAEQATAGRAGARQGAVGRGATRRDGPKPGGPGVLLTLSRARDALGLDYDEFDVAVQIGEVRTVACGPRTWKVPPGEVTRLCAEEGHPQPLAERVRLVSGSEAAQLLGIGRERFVRLTRTGYVRPVRWYVNRYRALVWMYLAQELPAFAEQSPALLRGPLPEGLREAAARGEDERARGWRARRVAQLVRDAYDAWDEAAVWAALLGPDIVDDAMPDPFERAHLRKLRGELPPGRTGLATPQQIRVLTTADHPDEIALGLVALADALGRARMLRPAPGPASVPAAPPGPALAVAPGSVGATTPEPGTLERPSTPGRSLAPDRLTAPAATRTGLSPAVPVSPALPLPALAPPAPTAPPEQIGAEAASGPVAGPPAGLPLGPEVRPAPRRGLRRLLPGGRRSAAARAGHEAGWSGRVHSSPTSVRRMTARPSSSEAVRSTSAERPQP